MYDQVLKEMWAVHRSQDFEGFVQNALKLYVFLSCRRILLHDVIYFPYTTTVVAVQLLILLVVRD